MCIRDSPFTFYDTITCYHTDRFIAHKMSPNGQCLCCLIYTSQETEGHLILRTLYLLRPEVVVIIMTHQTGNTDTDRILDVYKRQVPII